MSKLEIITNKSGQKIAVLPDVIFANKQRINWNNVEEYLRKYVGELVEVASTSDIIYIGTEFPNEYAHSNYTKSLKGARSKAKANAAQRVKELVEIAENKRFSANRKSKHSTDAANGWYYYNTRFAIPIYKNGTKTENYNFYTACLVVNHASNGKLYLYDIVDIKKEASKPLKNH